MTSIPGRFAARLARNFDRLVGHYKPCERQFIYGFLSDILGFSHPASIESQAVSGIPTAIVRSAEDGEFAVMGGVDRMAADTLREDSCLAGLRYLVFAEIDRWDIWHKEITDRAPYKFLRSVTLTRTSGIPDLVSGMSCLSVEHLNRAQCFGEGNRYRWYNYHDPLTDTVDLRFLVKFWLYEDRSEKLFIPVLNTTIWGDSIFEGRQYAEVLLDKFIYDTLQRRYPSHCKSIGIAPKRQTISVLRP